MSTGGNATAGRAPRPAGRHASPRLDLVLVICLSTIAATVCGFAPSSMSALRVCSALLLAFVLPGYAIVAAACPRGALSVVHRLIGVVAVSVMSSVLGGLALSLTGPGLTRAVWTTFLGVIAVVGSIVALVRWRNSPRGVSLRPAFKLGNGWAFLFVACLIVASGVYVSIRSAQAQERRQPAFTELSVFREPGFPNSIKIIVGSHEKVAQRYRLIVNAGRDSIATYSFSVQPGREWTVSMSVPVGDNGRTLEASLWCGRFPTVYRYVKLAAEAGVP